MATNKPCPLDRGLMINLRMKMGLNRVKAIESHVSAGGTCCNPSLKELVFKGSLGGSTPLLLACADGNLVVVKRIIEEWGVDPSKQHSCLDDALMQEQRNHHHSARQLRHEFDTA